MAGSRVNLAFLVLSTLILVSAVTLVAFPSYTNALIASMGGDGTMGAMAEQKQATSGQDVTVQVSPASSALQVVEARVTLRVDGMT